MAAKTSSGDDVIADINIVPLVDIILVVLIIFMVTATQFSSKELQVDLPKASSGSSSSVMPLVAQVNTAGQIFVDGVEMTTDLLRLEAEKRLLADPEAQAVVSADQNATHSSVVRALDAIKSAGLQRLAVSVEGGE